MHNCQTNVPHRVFSFLSSTLLATLSLLIAVSSLHAGSATWSTTPTNGDWNNPANWTPHTVPNSASDTATFGASSITNVFTSAITYVDSIVFTAGASAYTITVTGAPDPYADMYIEGAGIVNNSGIVQNFVSSVDSAGNESYITFDSNSSAGNLTTFTSYGGIYNGNIFFKGTSSATNSTFINWSGGELAWSSTGSAGSSTFINNADEFTYSSTAWATGSPGNSTFINNGGTGDGAYGGSSFFYVSPASATLIANGGSNGGGGGSIVLISSVANGGSPRVQVFGNGYLDLSASGSSISIGSLEGNGLVYLEGATNLSIGNNNLSTKFAGKIQWESSYGGSLSKTGKGRLSLSKSSTYGNGTTVTRGSLLVTNKTGSATGTGPVAISGGTLGGTGIVSGAITVGTPTKAGILAPGAGGQPGTLTTLNTVTFKPLATYTADIDTDTATADKILAKGVTINSGAVFSATDLGTAVLPVGSVFIVIDNTSATAISGTFSNVPGGSIIAIGSNNYQASYTGGDGNDLTLTVVP